MDRDDDRWTRRGATWLQATPAEAAGLVLLLVGALLASALLWWQATQRPDQLPPAGAAVGAGGGAAGDPAAADGDTASSPVGAPVTLDHDPDDVAGPGNGPAAPVSPSPSEAAPGPVIVHVTGAVAEPGIVTLSGGARVADAVAAAGGAAADAQLHLVNLARLLEDGEHVHLPREGEEVPPTAAVDGASDAGTDAQGRIDLNRAGEEQLQTLPGIGPSKAQAIVRHRDEHGPFAVPGDLRAVPGIGERTFQNLAHLVTVS